MHLSSPARHRHLWPLAGASAGLVACLAVVGLAAPAESAATSVPLGTTAQFAILAGAGITNTGATTIAGDIGTFPTTSITGSASMTIAGTNRGGDSVVQGAKPDLVTAYDAAAGALPVTAVPADLGGKKLVAGVYGRSAALGLTGTVTLDGQNDRDSVFIFQAGSTLKTATSAKVVLINGAQACNVFWQVGSSATFGTSTSFKGNVLALTSISAGSRATFEGRLLARNGAVTLIRNTITRPGCLTGPEPTPSTTTATSTPTATAVPTATPTGASPTEGSTPVDGDDDGADDADADGGADADADSDADGSGDSDADGGADADGTPSTTDLPDTGGPSAALLPLGAAGVLAGAITVAMARRPRGSHRA